MSFFNVTRIISNIYTYPFNPQLVIETFKSHDKKPKDQRNLYVRGPYFLNGWAYFNLGEIFFQQEYNHFLIIQNMYAGVHLLQFFNALTSSPIRLFFKCIKLHQILSLFSTINLAYVLEINIFGRDYSNLNNLFQRY